MEAREKFEALPEIADSLSEHIYFGSDNLYHSSLINFQGLVNWLNGAYYAFQEQEKKIDEANKMNQKMMNRMIELSAELEKLENRMRRME